ncbi:MAG: aldehyde dehydrogenase family protein, partial [Myxococcales bacterium]|nr:aldehyde dehydrogenase family protein [Myxococcales bacterium]
MPTTINPATGEPIQDHPFFLADETSARLARAHETFEAWRRRPLSDRAALLQRLASVIEAGREQAAALMVAEMGKPIAQARGELDKCARLCRHYAEQGPAMLAAESLDLDGARAEIVLRPIGPILAIMPWNFPWWQALRFAVPALLAGNTVLLQHAPNTTGSALAIEHALREAGFPIGCLEALIIDLETSAKVIADPRIRGVTLTGSTRAGRAVGELAGRNLKKCVLELGGSDPYLVLADADLEQAAKICAWARLQNSGQTCVAAKRFIVCAAVAEEF